MHRLAVVVCVHDALEYAKICLDSVLRHTDGDCELIVVDDGSGPETSACLRDIAASTPRLTLIANETARGYTCAANQGLRHSKAEHTILLNSDTIVSPGWADRLIACAESDPKIGIVGPLSNAATYQSVPVAIDESGQWAQNTLPEGETTASYARSVTAASGRTYPRVPVVNGFCFSIRRVTLDAIGYLDEESFPQGYGEENDYCVRAAAAGLEIAVADDAYVYHAVSKSFGAARRDALVASAHEALRRKYPPEVFDAIDRALIGHAGLAAVRERLDPVVVQPARAEDSLGAGNDYISILFLLPHCAPEAGGTQVVVETALGIRAMGGRARLAVPREMAPAYHRFFGDPSGLFFFYDDEQALMDFAADFRVGVATIFHSTGLLAKLVARYPAILPAYFVQDYEPWFVEPDTPLYAQAEASYELIPGCVLFALSPWVCEIVAKKHDVDVHKVWGSLDQVLFYPDYGSRLRADFGAPVVVSAMVRPATPWRGAEATLRVLAALHREFKDDIVVEIFGCEEEEVRAAGLTPEFPFVNRGRLDRAGVAAVLQASDVFLDLSKFQAFGRTALEAMACGCAVVAPSHGGVWDFGTHERDILLVNTQDEPACIRSAARLVGSRELRQQLSRNAAEKAAEYSIQRSSRSVLQLFAKMLAARR